MTIVDKIAEFIIDVRHTFLDNDTIRVSCLTTYDPKRVEIDLPVGTQIIVDYDTYQKVRQIAELPDVICD